jgi:hypothetical protein
MPALMGVHQYHDLEEGSHVQGVGGDVEPEVRRHRPPARAAAQSPSGRRHPQVRRAPRRPAGGLPGPRGQCTDGGIPCRAWSSGTAIPVAAPPPLPRARHPLGLPTAPRPRWRRAEDGRPLRRAGGGGKRGRQRRRCRRPPVAVARPTRRRRMWRTTGGRDNIRVVCRNTTPHDL